MLMGGRRGSHPFLACLWGQPGPATLLGWPLVSPQGSPLQGQQQREGAEETMQVGKHIPPLWDGPGLVPAAERLHTVLPVTAAARGGQSGTCSAR